MSGFGTYESSKFWFISMKSVPSRDTIFIFSGSISTSLSSELNRIFSNLSGEESWNPFLCNVPLIAKFFVSIKDTSWFRVQILLLFTKKSIPWNKNSKNLFVELYWKMSQVQVISENLGIFISGNGDFWGWGLFP